MKDMPSRQPEGWRSAATCRGGRPGRLRDARDDTLASLPPGAVVGSSSARRRAQLRYRRPDLELVEFRGNVETRLRKLEEGGRWRPSSPWRGCGRLGLADLTRAPIEPREMLPAVAQGARSGSSSGGATTGSRSCWRRPRPGHRASADGGAGLPGRARRVLPDPDRRPRGAERRPAADPGEILRPDGSDCVTAAVEGPISEAAGWGRSCHRAQGAGRADFLQA